nr:uncharacterized protein LOC131786940 [Pocillopora verrucosa]
MATALEYSSEQLNYYRICYVVTDVLTEGLRIIFKQEWDNRYWRTWGKWKDQPNNGLDFWNGESSRKRSRNARLLTTMKNGDTAEWDCTMLFYAILYSDCIHGLNPTVKSHVDDLRKLRNEDFAHMPRGHLSEKDFQSVILKVKNAFLALGLPTQKIHDIQNQTTFPTEELTNILKTVDENEKKLQDKDNELLEKRKELLEKEEQRQVLEQQLLTSVSPFCVLPLKPTHDVTGRDSEVSKIAQQLRALKYANNDALSTLYISGNPGSGKSQLARLVAKRFYDEVKENPYTTSFVMTLNAENSETLLESYVVFARHCKCPEYAITDTVNSTDLCTDEKIRSLKTLIGARISYYTSWLLVIDNVINVSQIHGHVPDAGDEEWVRGQLLITTQDAFSIPLTNSEIQHVSVSEGMHPDDARSLLTILSGVNDGEMEDEVARALDYQPLALASASIYVREVRQSKVSVNFGWGDYLEKLVGGQRNTTETILTETNPSYKKSMTTAITLAVEKVMTTERVINHLFTFLALCSPHPIPQDVAVNYIMEMDEEFSDKEWIVSRINRCSLILSEEEGNSVYIRVHGVVRFVLDSLKTNHAKDLYIKAVVGAVASFAKVDDFDTLIIGSKVVPQLRKLIQEVQYLFPTQELSQFSKVGVIPLQDYLNGLPILGLMCLDHCEYEAAMNYFQVALEIIHSCNPNDALETKAGLYLCLGTLYRHLGDFQQAQDYYARALDIRLKQLGPDHVDVAASYNNLGTVYSDLGDFQQAQDYYARALDIRLKQLGPEHVHVAASYNNLGTVYSDLGDFQQAKDYYQRALDIRLKQLGPEHVDVAGSYNKLGTAYRKLGDFQQAQDYYARSLDIRLKQLRPEHEDVAASYNNLGTLYSDLGDFQQAKDYHARALDVRLKQLGPEHEGVAASYNNLGTVYRHLGDFQQAKDYYARALDIRLKQLGPEHVDVAGSYNKLGTAYRKLGDFQEAQDYYARSLDIRLKQLGPEHVDVAASYNNLGTVYSDLGDFQQAQDYYARALDIRLKQLGPEHVDVTASYNNLGTVYSDLGDFQQAKDYHARALDVRLKQLGPEHEDVAASYNKLGTVYRHLGDFQQAKDYYARALDIRLKQLGPQHVDVASSYNKLGTAYRKLGDFQEAQDYYARSLDIRLKQLGPEHVDVAASYNNLGTVYSDLVDFQQAQDYYVRALDIRLKQLGPEHVDVTASYNNLDVASSYNKLGTAYRKLGDFQQAQDYYARSLDIRLKQLGPEHLDVASSYNKLGTVYRNLGDFQQAQDYYARALDISLKQLGPDHLGVGKIYVNIGDAHNEQGHDGEAKRNYDRALAIYVRSLGPEHVDVRIIQNKLAQLLQNTRMAFVDVDTRVCPVTCSMF